MEIKIEVLILRLEKLGKFPKVYNWRMEIKIEVLILRLVKWKQAKYFVLIPWRLEIKYRNKTNQDNNSLEVAKA